MKKEIADKWVEALRSGKYKQTSGSLKDQDRFCCLGVLCEISNLSNWEENKGGYLGRNDMLPNLVIDWSGMKSSNGEMINSRFKPLSALNDELEYSFEDIADVIEKNWEKL